MLTTLQTTPSASKMFQFQHRFDPPAKINHSKLHNTKIDLNDDLFPNLLAKRSRKP